MKTSLKRLVAGASIVALVAMNTAFATNLSLTGSTGTGLTLTGQTLGDSYTGVTVTGSLNLTVLAQVFPTLSFEISSGSLNLGELNSSKISTGSMDITLSTNATDGATVTVDSNTGGLASTQGDLIAFTGVVNQGEEGYNLTISDAVVSKGEIPTITNSTYSGTTLNEIMKVGNPTDTAKVTVQANASITSITPAGNYSVVHTFTVTGKF